MYIGSNILYLFTKKLIMGITKPNKLLIQSHQSFFDIWDMVLENHRNRGTGLDSWIVASIQDNSVIVKLKLNVDSIQLNNVYDVAHFFNYETNSIQLESHST